MALKIITYDAIRPVADLGTNLTVPPSWA